MSIKVNACDCYHHDVRNSVQRILWRELGLGADLLKIIQSIPQNVEAGLQRLVDVLSEDFNFCRKSTLSRAVLKAVAEPARLKALQASVPSHTCLA